MRKIYAKVRQFAAKARYLIPSALPVGAKEFEDFFQSIVNTYDLPNLPSYKQAIATMIMHLGQSVHKAPKSLFAKCIKKSMANQVAYEIIQQIRDDEKLKQQEAAAALEKVDDEKLLEQPVQN